MIKVIITLSFECEDTEETRKEINDLKTKIDSGKAKEFFEEDPPVPIQNVNVELEVNN